MAVSHTDCLLSHVVDSADNVCLVFTRTHLACDREGNLSSAIQGCEGNRRCVRREVIGNLDVNQSTITVAESAQLVRIVHVRRKNESLVGVECVKNTVKHSCLLLQVLHYIIQLILLLLVDSIVLIFSILFYLLIGHARFLLTLLSILDILLFCLGCSLHGTLLIPLGLVRNLLVEVLLHGRLLLSFVFIPSLTASQSFL